MLVPMDVMLMLLLRQEGLAEKSSKFLTAGQQPPDTSL